MAETTTGCLLEGSGIGRKGVSSEEVAKKCVESLLNELVHEACVDTHVQDQVLSSSQLRLMAYSFLYFS